MWESLSLAWVPCLWCVTEERVSLVPLLTINFIYILKERWSPEALSHPGQYGDELSLVEILCW